MSEKERIAMPFHQHHNHSHHNQHNQPHNNIYHRPASAPPTNRVVDAGVGVGGGVGGYNGSGVSNNGAGGGKKYQKSNRNKKYHPQNKNNHRQMDENEMNEFQSLVNWRSSASLNTPKTANNTIYIQKKSQHHNPQQNFLPHHYDHHLPHHLHHHHNQPHHHLHHQHHYQHHDKSKSCEYYPESKSSYHHHHHHHQPNSFSKLSFSIELTEYDFEEMNQQNNNCLDDELEIYLKSVYAKSDAVLDLHAKRLAIAAEKSKQTATEKWLLSRTPEERNRYLQSRNMAAQF